MTVADKIMQVRVMVDEPNTDEDWADSVILTYLNIAGEKILNRAYPYDDSITEIPKRYNMLQCEIAAYLLNKRGAEGETYHSENGIHRTYENADVPESLMANIVPFVGVI